MIKDTIDDDIKFTNQYVHTIKEDECDDDYDDDVKLLNWNILKERMQFASMKKCYMKLYTKKIMQEIANGEWGDKQIVEMHHKLVQERSNKIGNVLWITMNPDTAKCTVHEFIKHCHKFIGKKWVVSAIYLLEQRSTTTEDMGYGYHAHFLIWREPGKRPNQIIKETKSHWNGWCGDVNSYNFLNIESCLQKDMEYRKEYMLGLKKNKISFNGVLDDKKQKQKIDLDWRIYIGEPPSYSKNVSE